MRASVRRGSVVVGRVVAAIPISAVFSVLRTVMVVVEVLEAGVGSDKTEEAEEKRKVLHN